METPDANGFVNVIWPSKSVPHGGIFHTRVIEPSKTQQQFLKILLEESKLSIAQRKKSALALREYEEKEPPPRVEVPMVRPRTSRRRSLSAIRESGIYEVTNYRPLKRGEDREKLKDNLAHKMEYGDEGQVPPAAPRSRKSPPRLPTKKEMWHDLVTQIRERAEWLAEMEDLGQGAPHREVIKDQIAERMRALDALGLDSEPCTARSKGSGFSVLPSVRSNTSAKSDKSSISRKSQDKTKSTRTPKRHLKKDENVAAYEKLSPLQYSPRRRL
ncbi:UPF0193 protein EVG1 homolog [Zerene cesonia]|uniref:UPF0193 protein EVG1 homolog n=1 Tax=Zerene cesonia TaxID=33412 RepID=UPI0018E50015|nr:UPF0193 protein EVG1 homolog [Zerene cesonia]